MPAQAAHHSPPRRRCERAMRRPSGAMSQVVKAAWATGSSSVVASRAGDGAVECGRAGSAERMRTPHHPVAGVGRLDPEQARLACRADTAPTRETPMKILVAVDGSPYTKRMLAYLAALDDLLGPKHDYTVVHSVLAVP